MTLLILDPKPDSVTSGTDIAAEAIVSLNLATSYRHWSDTLPVLPGFLCRLAEVLTLLVPDPGTERPLLHAAIERGARFADQWQVLGNSLSVSRASVSAVLGVALKAADVEVRCNDKVWLLNDSRPLLAWQFDADMQSAPILVSRRAGAASSARAALRRLLRVYVWNDTCEALLHAPFDELCPPR